MRNSLVFLGFVGGLGLAACASGPDFQRPAAPQASAYRGPDQSPTTATPVAGGASQRYAPGTRITADWYRLFGSPKLDALIDRALRDNPTLEAAQARLHQARYELATDDAALYPKVDASLGAARERSNASGLGLSSTIPPQTFNLYSAGLSLSYDLDLAGGNRRAIESGEAQAEAKRYELLATYLTLVDNLVVTALDVAMIHDRIVATESIIQNDKNQFDLVRGQLQAGAVSEADVLRSSAQLSAELATLPALRQALQVQQTQLAILSGMDPGSFETPDFTLADFKLPETLPYSLPSELVRQRPDILAAESRLHAANAEVGVATANLYPHLTLSASYGGMSNDSGILTSPAARTWEIGGGLLAPIFHGGELRAQRDTAVEVYNASYAQYRSTVLAAFGQVTDVLNAVHNDADGLQAQHASLTSALASRDLVQVQYRAGAVDLLDVLAAEQVYDHADLAYIGALGQRYVDTASLYQSLGGGWWNATSSTAWDTDSKDASARSDATE